MSKEGEKSSVFLTTKVRTRLRGDDSWMLRRNDAPAEPVKEKPWLAEVRASRLTEPTSPVSSTTTTTTSTPPPSTTDSERSSPSGYLIRGVFTKLDKPASSTTTNGVSQTTTQYTKKSSDTYKKLAPYNVKTTPDTQEPKLSNEDVQKRTEAASSVLKKSAVRQRSYVLSAAKKFEAQETSPSKDSSSPAFVARRVEITDDDESAATAAPASSPPPVIPTASVASTPEPKPQGIVDTSVKTAVNELVAPKVEEEAVPEPKKDDPPPVPVAVEDPFEGMKPGCTKVATPLPELLPELVQAVHTEPEDSGVSEQVDSPLVELVSVSPAPMSPTPAPPVPLSPVPLSPAPVSAVTEITVKTEPEPEISPKPRSSVDTLTALSDTLISFNNSSSFKDDEPVLAQEEGSSAADTRTTEDGAEREPAPELSNCIPMTDDLLALTAGPEESAEPVPPSPGRWSQDLLSGLDSESNPAKTSGVLDLLSDDVIPINTGARSLSMQQEEKPTDETVKETQSLTETVTITTETVIISDKSQDDSADPWSSQSHVTTTVTESSQEDDSADPWSSVSRVTTTVTESSQEDSADPWSSQSNVTTTVTESSNQEDSADPWSSVSRVTTTVTESSSQDDSADPWSSVSRVTTTVTESSNQDDSADPWSSVSRVTTTVTESSSQDDSADPWSSVSRVTTTESSQDDSADPWSSVPRVTTAVTESSQEDSTDPWSSETRVTTTVTESSQDNSADPLSSPSRVRTTVTESSLADPFDPYPIGTTSSNSSSDLLQPLRDVSISSSTTFMENKDPSPETNISSNALESLADDVIPINTGTTSLSSHRWERSWDPSPPQLAYTEESQETLPGGQTVDQQTLVMFERKSSENDSPWDRWTSPTVYTVTTATGEEEEEEEEEESSRYTQTQTETVTTITTIREIHSDPQPSTDRYETYSRTVTEEEEQRVQTPEPEAKKGFVYVKEYVNATELNSGSSYSYSSPSTYSSVSLSSTCNFCGELVGNDARITIEHLNINCHPSCFKCGVCDKPMGDLMDSMFIHGGKVHCEICYSRALD